MDKPRIFVGYGKDHRARDDVSNLLMRLGLRPVVFSKSPDKSKTVIEKFEESARQCEFAILLLTPDDKVLTLSSRKRSSRARQNVIFELGWFFGRIGREKTLLLRKGAIEFPSNVRGVLYKQYKETPLELHQDIANALRAGGVRTNSRRRS